MRKLLILKKLCSILCHHPLSIATADGSKRGTQKSALLSIIKNKVISEDICTIRDTSKISAYILDFMALLKTITDTSSTYEDLPWRVIKQIPTGENRVDIVADTYRPVSINMQLRYNRVMINSVKSKIPSDFKQFLSNGDNKSKLVNRIFKYFVIKKTKVLNNLRSTKLLLSEDGKISVVTLGRAYISDALSSDQEEADTKVILHLHDALQESSNSFGILGSPSGDTYILVLAVAHLYNEKQRVYIDSGRSNSRKVHWLNDIVISENEVNSLISFHTLTWNDFVSSFFRKGKLHCRKVMEKSEKFFGAIQQLGAKWKLAIWTFQQIQEYICALYGSKKCKRVNELQPDMFDQKCTKENKTTDLALLPTCESTLMLHCKRSNYVAKIWTSTLSSTFNAPKIYENGWTVTGDIE